MLTLSSAVLIVTLLPAAIFYDRSREYNALESATYGAISRAAWSIGTVGVLFVVTYGTLTPINRVLAWKTWVPLSKLTYGAFLIHFQFQMRSAAMATSPIDFGVINLVSIMSSECLVSFRCKSQYPDFLKCGRNSKPIFILLKFSKA